MEDFRKELVKNFIYYTTFDTMSDSSLTSVRRPTSDGQIKLLNELKSELEEIGIDAYVGKEGYVKGVLKGTKEGTPLAFMAHVDTADDVLGNGVKAECRIYNGGDIILKNGTVIKAEDNPDLEKYISTEIITSDGSTLLGADDKAGVAIIMSAVKYLSEHKELSYPDIEIYFTSDEETGCGMDGFPYSVMNASVCYTFDGGEESYIETECFNAATMSVSIKGVSMHFGSARGILVNAITIASQIISTLPQAESPEATDGYFGYYGPDSIKGTAAEAELSFLIRDHDSNQFNFRIEAAKKLVESIAYIYRGKAEIDTKISYHNMGAVNKERPEAVDRVVRAGEKCGIKIEKTIIRGGTDGARIAEHKKISAPNLFTGGHNYHSLREWVSVDAMNRAANLMIGIAQE